MPRMGAARHLPVKRTRERLRHAPPPGSATRCDATARRDVVRYDAMRCDAMRCDAIDDVTRLSHAGGAPTPGRGGSTGPGLAHVALGELA